MRFVALLRGINVTGANRIPMTELRPLCESLGWKEVETYIQSGNVVFEAKASEAKLETALEKAVQETFHLTIPVIVRSAEAWKSYLADNPFSEKSEKQAKFIQLHLSKTTPNPDTVETLTQYALNGEQMELINDGLWIFYANGVGKSKISPARLDKAAGSPVTARNWNTVVKLAEMLGVG